MILQLDDKQRVFGAEHCWELQRLRKGRGGVEWRAYKYFPTLGDALRQAAHAEIRTTPVEGVADAIKAVEQVVARYSAIIDGAADRIAEKAREAAA